MVLIIVHLVKSTTVMKIPQCARDSVDSGIPMYVFLHYFVFCSRFFFLALRKLFIFSTKSIIFPITRFRFRCHSDWAFGNKYRRSSLVNCIQRTIQRHRCQWNRRWSQRQRWIKNRLEKRTKGAQIATQKTIIRPMITQWNHRRPNTIITWHCLEVYRNMDLGDISFLVCYFVVAHS